MIDVNRSSVDWTFLLTLTVVCLRIRTSRLSIALRRCTETLSLGNGLLLTRPFGSGDSCHMLQCAGGSTADGVGRIQYSAQSQPELISVSSSPVVFCQHVQDSVLDASKRLRCGRKGETNPACGRSGLAQVPDSETPPRRRRNPGSSRGRNWRAPVENVTLDGCLFASVSQCDSTVSSSLPWSPAAWVSHGVDDQAVPSRLTCIGESVVI